MGANARRGFKFPQRRRNIMFPVFLLQDFGEAFGVFALIMICLMLYRVIYPELVGTPFLAIIIVGIIAFTLLVPFVWFRYLMFVTLVMSGIFWTFKPHRW